MRRDIENIKSPRQLDSCCPGHDAWPDDVYRNRRSIRARARGIKREHRYARRINRYALLREVRDDGE